MVRKGYPLIMSREVYYTVIGIVATEKMSMGKILNILLREALEARGLLVDKQLVDKTNVDKINESQLTQAYQLWDGLKPKARAWWTKKAEENRHLPIAQEILKRQKERVAHEP